MRADRVRTTQPPSSDVDPGATLDDEERALMRTATLVPGPPAPLGDVASERPIGEIAERYRVREVLGRGGMGEVRLTRDEAIGRDVAQKTMLSERVDSAAARRRFLREARVQAQLEHPSIVPVYDLGAEADGRPWFTMRRVRGDTLEEVLAALARGEPEVVARTSRRRLLEAFTRVCLAVDYAHARGVIHRDLKPGNIMLGDFGEVYVLDWGVAKLVAEHATDGPVIVPGAEPAGQDGRIGTPGYMAPEQLLGLDDRQDARTDVYALGAILFEILTLRRFRRGPSLEAIAAAEPKLDFPPDVAPELAALCERALAFDRGARCQSARVVAEEVERYLDGDRDVARRRALAEDRATAAAAAFARAAAPEAAEAGATGAHAEAMREVTAALALDAENEEAKRLLVSLLVEVPERMPPAVEQDMAVAARRDIEQYVRIGTYGIATWLLAVPVIVAMGVQAWAPVLLTSVLAVASILYAIAGRRSGDLSTGRINRMAALVMLTVASTTCFMGPFVLIPQVASATTLYIVFLYRTARERVLPIAMGVAAVAVPFLLELTGILPPAYAFSGGNVTIFGRAVNLAPRATLALLCYASVTSVVLPAACFSLVRDALSAAERRLFLHAWHLRQLVPDPRRVPVD